MVISTTLGYLGSQISSHLLKKKIHFSLEHFSGIYLIPYIKSAHHYIAVGATE